MELQYPMSQAHDMQKAYSTSQRDYLPIAVSQHSDVQSSFAPLYDSIIALCLGLGRCMAKFQCKPCAVQRMPTNCTCFIGASCAAFQEGVSSPDGLHLPEAGYSVQSLGACTQSKPLCFTDAPQHKTPIVQTQAIFIWPWAE